MKAPTARYIRVADGWCPLDEDGRLYEDHHLDHEAMRATLVGLLPGVVVEFYPRDDVKKPEFWISEKSGWEIKRLDPDKLGFLRRSVRDEPTQVDGLVSSLANVTELENGLVVAVRGLNGWIIGMLKIDAGSEPYREPYVDTPNYMFPVRHSQDDRDCYVTVGQINKRSVRIINEDPPHS